MNVEEKPLEVIYNSVCPVCDAGVCSYQKKLNPTHRRYMWTDINTDPEKFESIGVSHDDVRLKLHTIDRDGNLLVGMPAVASIWAETPGRKWLATIVRLPLLKHLFAQIYNLAALVLYRWNQRNGRW